MLRHRAQAVPAEVVAQDVHSLNSRTDGQGRERMGMEMESIELGRGSGPHCLWHTRHLDRWLLSFQSPRRSSGRAAPKEGGWRCSHKAPQV